MLHRYLWYCSIFELSFRKKIKQFVVKILSICWSFSRCLSTYHMSLLFLREFILVISYIRSILDLAYYYSFKPLLLGFWILWLMHAFDCLPSLTFSHKQGVNVCIENWSSEWDLKICHMSIISTAIFYYCWTYLTFSGFYYHFGMGYYWLMGHILVWSSHATFRPLHSIASALCGIFVCPYWGG